MMPSGLGVKVTHTNQDPTLQLCAIMTYATFMPQDGMALDGGLWRSALYLRMSENNTVIV